MLAQQIVPAIAPAPIPLLHTSEHPGAKRALARGELIRVRHGVAADARAWQRLAPWSRYLARVHAVLLTHPEAIFCHESAAALLGLPLFGDPETVHVLSGPETSAREYGGVRVHTSIDLTQVIEVSGVRIASPASTAVALARTRHHAVGLAVVDAALRAWPTLSREKLIADNENRPSSRGRRHARWVLERATSEAETPLESISRCVIEWLGFPAPQLQTEWRSHRGEADRCDFWWPELGVIGEADGDLKYDGRFGDPIALLRERRDRDARLREHQGVDAVAHWGWSDVAHSAPLRSLLLGHGIRPVAPENPHPLFTLRRALASVPLSTRETTYPDRDSRLRL